MVIYYLGTCSVCIYYFILCNLVLFISSFIRIKSKSLYNFFKKCIPVFANSLGHRVRETQHPGVTHLPHACCLIFQLTKLSLRLLSVDHVP